MLWLDNWFVFEDFGETTKQGVQTLFFRREVSVS